jgi:GTP cyclohydrolase II
MSKVASKLNKKISSGKKSKQLKIKVKTKKTAVIRRLLRKFGIKSLSLLMRLKD